MDMFKHIFYRPRIPPEWVNPLEGEILPLHDIPESAFASGKMGAGFGIMPRKNEIYSPVNGTIISIFPTLHNLWLRSECGLDILLHIGLGSMHLKGYGFECYVRENEPVSAGELLLVVDFPLIKYRIQSIITAIIFPEQSGKIKIKWKDNRPYFSYPFIY